MIFLVKNMGLPTHKNFPILIHITGAIATNFILVPLLNDDYRCSF